MKKHHIFSVVWSLILCLSLCLSMLPYAALAEAGSGTEPAVDPIVSPAGENVTLPPEEENPEEPVTEEVPEGGESQETPAPQPAQDTEASVEAGGENPGEAGTGTEETPVQAEEIVLDSESASLDALDTLQLSAQVYPEGCDQSVIWTSSDPSVAVVDANGLVTAVGRGEDGSGMATITATATAAAADGSELTASCYVTVRSDGRRVERVEELGSEHPYRDGESRFWEFTLDGAENLALTFAPETSLGLGDFLVLQFGDNEQITYTADNTADLAGQTLAIPGDGLRIWLISDDDGNTGWGFQVTEAAAAEEGDELAQSQDFADPLKNINSPRLMGADLGAADTNAACGQCRGRRRGSRRAAGRRRTGDGTDRFRDAERHGTVDGSAGYCRPDRNDDLDQYFASDHQMGELRHNGSRNRRFSGNVQRRYGRNGNGDMHCQSAETNGEGSDCHGDGGSDFG